MNKQATTTNAAQDQDARAQLMRIPTKADGFAYIDPCAVRAVLPAYDGNGRPIIGTCVVSIDGVSIANVPLAASDLAAQVEAARTRAEESRRRSQFESMVRSMPEAAKVLHEALHAKSEAIAAELDGLKQASAAASMFDDLSPEPLPQASPEEAEAIRRTVVGTGPQPSNN